MNCRRGEVVTCAPPGEFGKPRSAVVVQSDLFNASHASVTLCPITSHDADAPLFRVTLVPTAGNGLKRASQAMVDKLTILRADRIGSVVGQLSDDELTHLDEAILRWLGLRG
ncbi:MAG: type II toxin-antitoxin system PemK/MazF family toxin [Opitutus sp.]|nr:type II toxin-antitoxin system PemK/MazF family toxin [Opitutus sp.]